MFFTLNYIRSTSSSFEDTVLQIMDLVVTAFLKFTLAKVGSDYLLQN